MHFDVNTLFVYVFCWQIQSNELQGLFKCEFLSVLVPQMFFTFSVVVLFSHLSNSFMLKNSCLLVLLKAFANALGFFYEGIIDSLLQYKK